MEINPNDIQNMTKEYEKALSNPAFFDNENLERLIILEETQLDYLDCLTRNNRNTRTLNYLKNLTFRILGILSAKIGQTSYIPSVRTPLPCQNSFTNLINSQLDIFLLLDKIPLFSDKAEVLSLENRKTAILGLLRQ